MCGLVGIAGDLKLVDEDRFKRLLVLDWFRGKDSTGMAGIRSNGEAKIAKVTSHPYDLFDMGRFRDACNGSMSCALIGHNRAATRGIVNNNNAHPFQYGHIIGAHNGTLWHGSHTALEKAMGETFAVDSQAIIAGIAHLGIEETMGHLEGAWAIVYFNLKDGTLNFIRNKERNLWYASTKSKDHLIWASEWGMIKGAMYESESLIARDKDGHGFFEFQEDVHYSYDIRQLKTGKESPKPRVKKMEGKKPVPFLSTVTRIGKRGESSGTTPSRVSDPFQREIGGDGITRRQFRPESSTTQLGFEDKELVSVPFLNIDTSDRNPFGGELAREKFDQISKHGCSLCSGNIEWGDDGVVYWERDDVLICRSCSGLEGKKNRVYTTRQLTVAA